MTVWLREEFGNRAFFPDAANTKFNFPNDIVRLSISLIVKGSDPAVPGSSSSSVSSVPVATESASGSPSFVSVTGSKKGHSLNVKVVQATMKRLANGKCEFIHLGQTFVNVNESTAKSGKILFSK